MKASETHAWIHPISLAYVPGKRTPGLERTVEALLDWLRAAGCACEREPSNQTDVILTTARFGEPVERDEALLFHAKRRFRLNRRPMVITLVEIAEAEYQRWLDHFAELARHPEAEAARNRYPGLGPQAVDVLLDQARRGGPEVALGRFLQAHVKSVRVLALRVEAGQPRWAVHFDLAGAHPVTEASDLTAFARDAGLRLLAAACTGEVNNHTFLTETLSQPVWEALATPDAMVRAGRQFTQYGFFAEPIRIEKLLGYRGVGDAISAQYSEGCYAVFEPDISGLITTATGSTRLVDKRAISRADQAVVVAVRPDRSGAVVRPVAGMERVVPSVEAVEMMAVCEALPGHARRNNRGQEVRVPNLRALLHGHLGVAGYDPARVECVSLDPPYYSQLVSCGTAALAQGTAQAFARSATLRDLHDPRTVVFLEQPGHGVVVVEKWVEGLGPFDAIWACLESGALRMTMAVPQGRPEWEQAAEPDGRVVIQKVSPPEVVLA